MSRKKEKKKTTVGDVIYRIVFFIALAVFLYCAYRLITIYLEYKKGTDEYSALEQQYVHEEVLPSEDADRADQTDPEGDDPSKNAEFDEAEPETEAETETEIVEDEDGNTRVEYYPVLRNPIDFESLQEVNEDIIGWLKVNALDISYPIAQGEDNDYYLHRTFEGVENFAGCIFMEYQNSSDFSDKNTIIYGHNMKNGSMFGKLKKFYEEGVYESKPYFWIYTPDKIYRYDIFSCSQVGAYSDTYQITFSEDEDFETYIKRAFESSIVDGTAIDVDADDKIVTLSTCTGNEATRFVVQGKLARVYKSAPKENGNQVQQK